MSKSSLVYETLVFKFEIFIFAFESSRILDAFQRRAILKFLAFFIPSELRLPNPPPFYILEIAILTHWVCSWMGKHFTAMAFQCIALAVHWQSFSCSWIETQLKTESATTRRLFSPRWHFHNQNNSTCLGRFHKSHSSLVTFYYLYMHTHPLSASISDVVPFPIL